MKIREAGPDDAPSLAALLAELGYPDGEERVRSRVATFAGDPSAFVRTRGRGRRAARVAGCRYLEVTSGERPGREAAHAFYDALGLEQVSRRYLKEL